MAKPAGHDTIETTHPTPGLGGEGSLWELVGCGGGGEGDKLIYHT